MNDLINMITFSLIIMILFLFFKDINYKKVITLIKKEHYQNKLLNEST